MEKKNYKLSKDEVQVLITFLDRVQCKGIAEAQNLIYLVSVFQSAGETEENEAK